MSEKEPARAAAGGQDEILRRLRKLETWAEVIMRTLATLGLESAPRASTPRPARCEINVNPRAAAIRRHPQARRAGQVKPAHAYRGLKCPIVGVLQPPRSHRHYFAARTSNEAEQRPARRTPRTARTTTSPTRGRHPQPATTPATVPRQPPPERKTAGQRGIKPVSTESATPARRNGH